VSTRGTYLKMSSEKKAEIGKRAAEHGVLATVRYYASRLPELMISTDHRLNVESRHPFQVTCVDSCSYIDKREFQHVTPINNVGVACLGQ